MRKAPLIRERIAKKLREQIMNMRSQELVRIPAERTLASDLGVSRLSLRAAMKVLIDEGLLIQIQGSGTYITPTSKFSKIHVIIAPNIKPIDPIYNVFLSKISNWLAKDSIHLILVHPNHIVASSEDSPLIIVGLLEEKILAQLKQCFKTIISIQYYPESQDITQIYYDDYKIGIHAAKVLLEYQHKKIVLLSGPDRYPSAIFRKKGFLNTLEGSEAEVIVMSDKMNWTGGYNTGEKLIEKYTNENLPTAIFAANDWMAIGLMQRLKEAGISIPNTISVIGCDNIQLAREVIPSLTTFKWDMQVLMTEVIAILNKMQHSEYNSNKSILLTAEFILRDSLAMSRYAKADGLMSADALHQP